LRYRGLLFFLQSAFNWETSEYPNYYSVYALPDLADAYSQTGLWEFIEKNRSEALGQIDISSVIFDVTLRKSLDASILDPFIRT
jgi:hypothetical protein